MTLDFRGCTPDPDVRIGSYRLLQRTDGVWIAIDETRPAGQQTVFSDKSREVVQTWMGGGKKAAPKVERWTLRLSNEELVYLKQIADDRFDHARRVGRPESNILPDSRDMELTGVIGEYTIVRVMNLPWAGKTYTYKHVLDYSENGSDVGFDFMKVEVKSTRRHVDGRLCTPTSREVFLDRPYVLARINDSLVRLVGWAYGYELKRDEYIWAPPPPRPGAPKRPGYFLPNELLRSMESLEEMVEEAKFDNELLR